MALLADDLSVWTIGFRWRGRDPNRIWLRIPIPVQDNFRNLMDAILKAELACLTISLEKPEHNSDLALDFSVYRYLDDINACIGGHHFSRKLLRWAVIGRYDFKLWCERRGIPLPEFWFPPGWNLEYELPEDGLLPGHDYMRRDELRDLEEQGPAESVTTEKDERAPSESAPVGESPALATPEPIEKEAASQVTPEPVSTVSAKEEAADEKMRANQRARIACQQIASVIWKKEPTRTIASVVRDELIQNYGGGEYYEDATIREWVKVVAPPAVRAKRGRPLKKNGAPED